MTPSSAKPRARGAGRAGASEAIRGLARLDVLRPQFPLGFVHPLIRATVYEELTRSSEAAGTRARPVSSPSPERARAGRRPPPAPLAADSGVVALRGSRAARPLSRCSRQRRRVPPPGARRAAHRLERADLLLELGSAETLLSGEAAAEHLQEAHGLIHDPERRAEAAALLGTQLFYLHRLDESVAVFEQALDEPAAAMPSSSASSRPGSSAPASSGRGRKTKSSGAWNGVRSRGGDTTLGEKMLLALLAFSDARAGAPASRPSHWRAERWPGDAARGDRRRRLRPCGHGARDGRSRRLDDVRRGACRCAPARSISGFAATKVFRAQAFLFRGDLAEAEADSRKLDACRAWGLQLLDAFRFVSAEALMEQGKLAEAATALEPARPDESMPEDVALLPAPQPRAPAPAPGRSRRRPRGDGRRGCSLGAQRWPQSCPPALAFRRRARSAPARRAGRGRPAGGAGARARAGLGCAPRARCGLARCRTRRRRRGRALGCSKRRSRCWPTRPQSSSTRRRAPSLGRRRRNLRSAARDQLRRAVELATICGAAHWPPVPRPSFSPRARGRDASLSAASSHSHPASGASPRWRPGARPTARSRRPSS